MPQDDKEKLAGAMQLLSRGDYAQSEQIFKDLISSGSELAESFYGMGMIRLGSRQPDVAIKQFENCIKLQPNHANAHFYLGQIAEQRGDAESAKRFFEQALEINPKHAGALKKIGLAHQPDKAPEDKAPEASTMASDLYALFRRSTEPVEREIAHHLAAIAALIGTRRARIRAFISIPLMAVTIPCVLIAPVWIWLELSTTRGMPPLAIVFVPFLFFSFLVQLVVVLRARSSRITCERDWLLRSRGVLSRSTDNIHLFVLSRGQVSVKQTLINRITRDGTLKLTGLSLRGYFKKSELDVLSTHFRQLSLLNPTSRQILAAVGELKQIRSGAN